MIEVELPDGRVLEVETDDPQVAAQAGAKFQKRESYPTGQARALQTGVQGAGRGAAELAGAPVDLATMALNAIPQNLAGLANVFLPEGYEIPQESVPQIERPVGGSQSIADLFGGATEAAGVPLIAEEDMSTGERLGYNINRLGGQAIAGGAGLARSGSRAGATALEKGLAAPYDDALTAAAAAPSALRGAAAASRPMTVDTAIGAGAGAGLTATEPMDSPIADLISTLLGGGAGGVAAGIATAPRRAADWARYLFQEDPTTKPDVTDGSRPSRFTADEARKALQGEAIDAPAAAKSIREGAAAYDDAGMPKPTSGQLSNDEGMLSIERSMRRSVPSKFARNDREVSTAASEQLRSLSPGDTVDPRAATGFIQKGVDQRRGAVQKDVETAQGGVDFVERAERAAGEDIQSRSEMAGAASRELDEAVVEGTMRPMQAEQNKLYDAIPDDVELDATPLVEAARKLREDAPKGLRGPSLEPFDESAFVSKSQREKTPATEDAAAILEEVEEIGTVTTRDLKAMRPRLAAAIKQARSQANPDYARADALAEIKRTAESMIDDMPEAGEAVQYTREQMGPKFGQGEGGRLRKEINADDLARSKTPPTKTGSRFLQPGHKGSAEVASDLKRILAGDPESGVAPSLARDQGTKAARDYVMSDLQKVVGSDGKVSPTRLRQWIKNREGVFEAFPEMKAEVDGMLRDVVNRREVAGAMQSKLERATAAAKRTEKDIQNSAMSLVLDKDPVSAVQSVFGSGDAQMRMRDIVKEVKKDPEALKGWKKAISEYLEQKVGKTNVTSTLDDSRNVSLAEMENLFKRHEKALQEVYSPTEMQALRRAQMAVRDLSRSRIAGSGPGVTTTAEDIAQMLRYTELGVRAKFGHIAGGGIMRSIKMAIKTVPGLDSEQRVAQLIRRAMFDPELAATLLDTPTTRPQEMRWNKRMKELLAGLGYLEGGEDDE